MMSDLDVEFTSVNTTELFLKLKEEMLQIRDYIIKDLYQEASGFEESMVSSQLSVIRSVFWRISWINKRNYVMLLIEDANLETLAIILRAIWNILSKDVMYMTQTSKKSCVVDKIPFDHNRMAVPRNKLYNVLKEERNRINTLSDHHRGCLIIDLLSMSGTVVVREASLYALNKYNEKVTALSSSIYHLPPSDTTNKLSASLNRKSSKKLNKSAKPMKMPSRKSVTSKNSKIAVLKQKLNITDVEIPQPNGPPKHVCILGEEKGYVETIDMIQLLPITITKRIFRYIDRSNYKELSKVNKYWNYVLDELIAEENTRRILSNISEGFEKYNVNKTFIMENTKQETNPPPKLKSKFKHHKMMKCAATVQNLQENTNSSGAANKFVLNSCYKTMGYDYAKNQLGQKWDNMTDMGLQYFQRICAADTNLNTVGKNKQNE